MWAKTRIEGSNPSRSSTKPPFGRLVSFRTMFNDFGSTLLVLLSFVATFVVARLLSRNFRAKRKAKEEARREAERRATESRQVRRARERRGS